MSKIFLVALLLILTLRISLFYLTSFPYDMGDWKAWSIRLVQVSSLNFYSKDYFSDYFPGYLYILWISGLLFKILSIPINSQIFEIFIKGITTIFDFGTAYFIFKIVSKHNVKLKYFAPILYLLNPAIILNSSVWGQIDGIFTFFLVTSLYFIFEKKEIFKSGFFSLLAILVKPHSLVILPAFLLYGFKNFSINKFYKSIILGILVFILLSVPFFPKNPILGIFELAVKSQDVYKYNSLYAFNFWALFGWWKPDDTIFLFSYKIWGIILFIFSIILIMLPLLKKKIEKREYYLAVSLSFISSFILLTRMHERYLFPFLAFILISSLIYKSKFLFMAYIVISILHFINLWFVYYNYVYVYGKKFVSQSFFYNSYSLINSNYNYFSILMIVIYLSIFIFYFKFYAKKNKAELAS